MSFSSLVAPGNIHSSAQRSSRGGATIDHFILHHSAAFDAAQVLAEMVSGSKQVSANYVVGNDGTAYGVVDEEDRAWTSGSSTDGGRGAAWDKRSITFEILDMTGAPDWLISPAAQATVAAIIADVSKRHGITPQRAGANTSWTVYGHRELYTIYAASYSTACPGGLPLDSVTQAAAALLNPVTPTTEKDSEMELCYIENSNPGQGDYILITSTWWKRGDSVWVRQWSEPMQLDATKLKPISEDNVAKVIADIKAGIASSTVAPVLSDAQIAAIAAQVKVPAAPAVPPFPTIPTADQIAAAVVKAEGTALSNG
jgi:hypothetical protein